MPKITRDEAHAFLRQSNVAVFVSSYEPEGLEIKVPRNVAGFEVRQYLFELERRLLTLSNALADHLEGKPIKAP